MRGMRGTHMLLCDSGRCGPARAAALGWLTDSASLSARHRLETSIAPALSSAALIEAVAWRVGGKQKKNKKQTSKQNKTMNLKIFCSFCAKS